MIKISSFSLINNLAKRTWEFYEDKLIFKVRSLTVDYETEVVYEKIKIIRNKKMKDLSWVWVAFSVVVILGLVDLTLRYFGLVNSTIATIEKVIAVLALFLLILASRTLEYYSFLDADQYYLTTVEVDKNSENAILEAIRLIKLKTKIIKETHWNDLLPNTSPVFQITEFDFPDFLNRVKVGFYEDKLVAVERSLAEEIITVIRYDEFSGKTKSARTGNDKWDTASSYWLIFVCITGVTTAIFFAEQVRGNSLYFQSFVGGLLLIIPIVILKYVKSEIVIFYDKKDNGIFWLQVNPANREKLNQIVAFVRERVSQTIEKPA